MLTTPAEPSDQHHIEVQRLPCARARRDSQDVTRCWDMIFCSVRLAGGCSTGISFEVGSTTLLIPPGERKAFGWRGARSAELEAHVGLQFSNTSCILQSLLSQSPLTSSSPSGKELPWQSLPSTLSYCRCGYSTPTFTLFTPVLLGQALQQNM